MEGEGPHSLTLRTFETKGYLRVKVAFIHREDGLFNLKDSRGTQVVMRNECHALLRKGVEVDLLATRFVFDEDAVLRERSRTIPAMNPLPKRLRRYLSELAAGWMTRDYDILHLEASRPVRPYDPKRALVHFHGLNWENRIKPSQYRKAARYHYCFVSEFLRSFYLEHYDFLNKDKCHLLINGVDIDLFKPQQKTDDTVFTFGYASRLHTLKGLWVLLDAVKILESKRKDFKVLVAGAASSGAEEINPDKEMLVQSKMKPYLDALETVEVVGPIPHLDLPSFYRRLDAMLVPSVVRESCPLVVLEAMASGRPVIASRVGGIPEILPGVAGDLVEVGNVEALADAMEHWLDHPDRVREKGLRAREYVVANHSWEDHADKLLRIYDKVLDR